MSTTCRDCDSRWTGLNEAHCTGCHRTFGGISGFDRHKKPTGECLDPATLGMTEVQRVGHAAWVRPPGRSAANAPWACRGDAQPPDPPESDLGGRGWP